MKKMIFVIMSITMLLVGCGTNASTEESKVNQETQESEEVISQNQTIALSEYLSGDLRILYECIDEVGKDTAPRRIYVFDNGSVTLYKQPDISFGDLSKMTDEDIVLWCDENVSENNRAEDDSINYVVFSDKTGNETEYEGIVVNYGLDKSKDGKEFTDSILFGLKKHAVNSATVYESQYAGITVETGKPINASSSSTTLWYRTNGETVVLDGVDSDNVEVDPADVEERYSAISF